MVSKDDFLNLVTNHYLSSHDFNGYSLSSKSCDEATREVLCQLIEEGKVDVVFSDVQTNPHVKLFDPEERDVQLQKVRSGDWSGCVYPSPGHLQNIVNPTEYEGQPYLLELALGAPQLEFKAFELSVLETYRNDPRYSYWHDDISGYISIGDQFYENELTPPKDKILLQSFGFCYDDNLNRFVAVFLRYLADLSPEHQQIWKAKEVLGKYHLHPDYYREAILAEWPEGISIFEAFLEEMRVINKMCEFMGRPPLFLNDFSAERRPREFGFLIRPTLRELNNFVHLLDKMMSDNINKRFFMREVPLEEEEKRSDGKIVLRSKGNITLLNEWIRKFFRPAGDNWAPVDEMISTFREIRRLRQKPAHTIEDDIFDMRYFHQQRDLILRAYKALRLLRLLLANHPLVKAREHELKIDERVQAGNIWTY